MKNTKHHALSEVDLDRVSGGRAAPTLSARDGGQPDGNIQLNEDATGLDDPQAVMN